MKLYINYGTIYFLTYTHSSDHVDFFSFVPLEKSELHRLILKTTTQFLMHKNNNNFLKKIYPLFNGEVIFLDYMMEW